MVSSVSSYDNKNRIHTFRLLASIYSWFIFSYLLIIVAIFFWSVPLLFLKISLEIIEKKHFEFNFAK